MAKPRVFIRPDSQAGCFHVVSRFVERTFRFYEAEKTTFVAEDKWTGHLLRLKDK